MGPSGQTSAPAEVMDEKPIGDDPHMREQQLQGREWVQRVPVGVHGQDQF